MKLLTALECGYPLLDLALGGSLVSELESDPQEMQKNHLSDSWVELAYAARSILGYKHPHANLVLLRDGQGADLYSYRARKPTRKFACAYRTFHEITQHSGMDSDGARRDR